MPATGEGAAACGRAGGVRGRPEEAAATRGAVAGVPLRRRMWVLWDARISQCEICTPVAPERVRSGSGRAGPVLAVVPGHAEAERSPKDAC